MDHHNGDKDSHSTATSYREDNHPTDESLKQFCDGLSSCLPLNNHLFTDKSSKNRHGALVQINSDHGW